MTERVEGRGERKQKKEQEGIIRVRSKGRPEQEGEITKRRTWYKENSGKKCTQARKPCEGRKEAMGWVTKYLSAFFFFFLKITQSTLLLNPKAFPPLPI